MSTDTNNEIWHQAGQYLKQQQQQQDQIRAHRLATLPPLPDGLSSEQLLTLAMERAAAVVDDDLPNIPEGADSIALIRLGTDRTSTSTSPPAPAAPAPAPAAPAPAGDGEAQALAVPPSVAAVLASIQAAMAPSDPGPASDGATLRRLFRELPGSDRDLIVGAIERESYGFNNYLRDPGTRDHAAVLVGDALVERLVDGRRLQPDLSPADLLAQLAAAAEQAGP